ncbi:hypothetical protein KFV02_06220 [Desulfohalobiaceae bacterium Ax17]|nr:hypothetical protein [Desulfovulcanus ferrireducens]
MKKIFFPLIRLWQESVKVYQIITNARWLILGALTGVISGILAIIFFAGVEGLKFLLVHKLAGFN